MKSWKHGQLLAAIVAALLSAIPAHAQVDKAAMRTTGISCGECAAVSEVYLRRLEGIDKITISKSQEVVVLTYKPGSSFQPWRMWPWGVAAFAILCAGIFGGVWIFVLGAGW